VSDAANDADDVDGKGRVNHGCCGGVCLKESLYIEVGIFHVARATQPCPCAQWEGRARGRFRYAGSICGGLERTGTGRGRPGIDGVLRRGPRRNAPSAVTCPPTQPLVVGASLIFADDESSQGVEPSVQLSKSQLLSRRSARNVCPLSTPHPQGGPAPINHILPPPVPRPARNDNSPRGADGGINAAARGD